MTNRTRAKIKEHYNCTAIRVVRGEVHGIRACYGYGGWDFIGDLPEVLAAVRRVG